MTDKQTPEGSTTELPELDFSTLDMGGWQSDEMFNFRDWLESALVAKGAEVTGKGAGCGGCDISIRLGGVRFGITARPTFNEAKLTKQLEALRKQP